MIYVIRDALTGHVKLGLSASPRTRLAKMRVDCPGELSLRAVVEGERPEEQALHERFSTYRLRGEWFGCEGALAEWVFSLPMPVRPRRSAHLWGDSGLTDDALAPLVGICRPQINRIRRGLHIPSLAVALKIAEFTGVSLESLLAAQPMHRANEDRSAAA